MTGFLVYFSFILNFYRNIYLCGNTGMSYDARIVIIIIIIIAQRRLGSNRPNVRHDGAST